MEVPIIVMLRLLWRLRSLLTIGFLIVLGHIWLNDAMRAWDNWRQPVEYCDQAHTLVYVPAEECGGISSCDRNASSAIKRKYVPPQPLR
jgi:hypothetical protein